MARILDSINDPAQLRKLTIAQMQQLAEEIRREIIEKVSVKGGHLAPNLGVVELTMALHYIFNTPNDLLVWDIGHQAYVHKLLTGRQDRFHTIRQFGGLSGYLRREESPYDVFGASHASSETEPNAESHVAAQQSPFWKGHYGQTVVVVGGPRHSLRRSTCTGAGGCCARAGAAHACDGPAAAP